MGGTATFNGGLTVTGASNIVLPGLVTWFAGTAAPSGWLACDGTAISRTTYASLFAAISTTYGIGDGTTTFNLPASARCVLVGSGGSGTSVLANTVGATGGEETHLLTTTELPAQTHQYTVTTYPSTTSATGGNPDGTSGGVTTTGSTGGGTAHNNMQPSLVMLMIIKY